MKITKLAVAIGAALMISAPIANAGDKFDFWCSPGYYKGHDDWQQFFSGDDVERLLGMLYATGAHNGDLKQAAALEINNYYIQSTKDGMPCEDGDEYPGAD